MALADSQAAEASHRTVGSRESRSSSQFAMAGALNVPNKAWEERLWRLANAPPNDG
jgi:hypothetical protein